MKQDGFVTNRTVFLSSFLAKKRMLSLVRSELSGAAQSRRPIMAQAADRVQVLKQKHATLEEAIRAENRRPRPDDNRLKSLKIEKLRIKDEMTGLTTH
jgi:hypothetical protein